jgi:hypothetical protein
VQIREKSSNGLKNQLFSHPYDMQHTVVTALARRTRYKHAHTVSQEIQTVRRILPPSPHMRCGTQGRARCPRGTKRHVALH